MSVLMVASQQWASRPPDQRFPDMPSLEASVRERTRLSTHMVAQPGKLAVAWQEPATDQDPGQLYVDVSGARFDFTNWSFGQVCSLSGSPAAFMRDLPGHIAGPVLKHRLSVREEALTPAKFLLTARPEDVAEIVTSSTGDRAADAASLRGDIRAVTSQSYGYISDLRVVRAVQSMLERNPNWQVPAASYSATDPQRATTLYASDRDVFIFLCDPDRFIDVLGRKLNRFFIVSNSEVGAATLDVSMGTYDYICDNRMIWGAGNVFSVKIRHTSRAPERFAQEVEPALRAYAESSTSQVEDMLRKAAEEVPTLPDGKDKGEPVKTYAQKVEFLRQTLGLGDTGAGAAVKLAEAEMGGSDTLFQMLNGVTAYARGIAHQDRRVDLETKVGNLFSKFAQSVGAEEGAKKVAVSV